MDATEAGRVERFNVTCNVQKQCHLEPDLQSRFRLAREAKSKTKPAIKRYLTPDSQISDQPLC